MAQLGGATTALEVRHHFIVGHVGRLRVDFVGAACEVCLANERCAASGGSASRYLPLGGAGGGSDGDRRLRQEGEEIVGRLGGRDGGADDGAVVFLQDIEPAPR